MDVRISIDLKSTIHLCFIVMSIGSFFRSHFLYSLFKCGIITLQQNHILRQQLSVDGVSRESIIRVRLNTFILLLKEDGFTISLGTGITVKNKTFVFAGSSIQLRADNFVKHLVRKANFDLRSVKFRVLLLVSCLFILCDCDILKFLDFSTEFIAESVLQFHSLCYQVTNSNDWYTVRLSKFGAEMRLTGCRRACNEHFQGEKSSETIEFLV